MKLRRLLTFGSYILISSSCTTLMHQTTVGVNFYSDVDSALVCVKDGSDCYVTPVTIDLVRSKSDIGLIVKKDTLIKP